MMKRYHLPTIYRARAKQHLVWPMRWLVLMALTWVVGAEMLLKAQITQNDSVSIKLLPAQSLTPTMSKATAANRLANAHGSWGAVKTNLLYWPVALPITPNLGAEVKVAKHWTLNCEVGLNPFKHKRNDGTYSRSFRHLRIHPEVRYWFCEAFFKHFVGLHIPFIDYNVSNIHVFGNKSIIDADNVRKQGRATGVGLSYGYNWPLAQHWNLEATVGGGWLRLNHKKYPCTECGSVIEHEKKNYVGLTQAGITLSYLF